MRNIPGGDERGYNRHEVRVASVVPMSFPLDLRLAWTRTRFDEEMV